MDATLPQMIDRCYVDGAMHHAGIMALARYAADRAGEDPDAWLETATAETCQHCGRAFLTVAEVLNGRRCEICRARYAAAIEEQDNGLQVQLKRAGVPAAFRRFSLSTWRGGWPAELSAWEREGGALLICGKTGIGKTHLATAALAAGFGKPPGHTGLWLDAPSFAQEMRQTAGASPLAVRAVGTGILVLDDLGKGHATDFYWAATEDVLRRRHMHGRRSLVTTQVDPRQIEALMPALYRRLTEIRPPLEL